MPPKSPILHCSVVKVVVCGHQALLSLTSRCPVVGRWAVAPASPLWGELLGGQTRPVGLHSCLPCHHPSSWAREQLQQPGVGLCKLPYAPGSFGTGWVPSGNEGKAPSRLDKGCSGAGSNRHLTWLNFQCSSFQRHMLGLNLLPVQAFANHSACPTVCAQWNFCWVDGWLHKKAQFCLLSVWAIRKSEMCFGFFNKLLATPTATFTASHLPLPLCHHFTLPLQFPFKSPPYPVKLTSFWFIVSRPCCQRAPHLIRMKCSSVIFQFSSSPNTWINANSSLTDILFLLIRDTVTMTHQ